MESSEMVINWCIGVAEKLGLLFIIRKKYFNQFNLSIDYKFLQFTIFIILQAFAQIKFEIP